MRDEAYPEAVIELSQALVEAPDDEVAQCYATRGYAHLCQGDFNKAIEIYNGTGGAVDLTGYDLELYSNGAASPFIRTSRSKLR